MANKKLSVIVSGAVSLGSYEAGVLTELFSALEKGSNFVVDVITGASAGSVNSAIFSLSVMYDMELIRYLEEIWVNGLDITSLLKEHNYPDRSIFSTDTIDSIKNAIVNAVQSGNSNPLPSHPDKMKVAFTLTNLTGIPYEIEYSNKTNKFTATTFADWYPLDLAVDQQGSLIIKNQQGMQKTPEIMLDMAIASASFPFAFPAMEIQRDWADYKAKAIKKPSSGGQVDFIYSDGGLLNNEPVNRAKELVDGLGGDSDDRIYLLVDPTPPELAPKFDKLTMTEVAKRVVLTVLTEAHFRDWYDAMKVNQRVQWQKDFIGHLITGLNSLDMAQIAQLRDNLRGTMGEFITEIALFKAKKDISEKQNADFLDSNRNRIASDIEGRMDFIPDSERKILLKDLMTDIVFALENVAGLREKKKLDIRILYPDTQLGIKGLAGDFMCNFGGFFEKKYREYDFFVGREVARIFLRDSKTVTELGIAQSYMDASQNSYMTGQEYPNVTIENVSIEKRKELRNVLVGRLGAYIENLLKIKWWQRLLLPVASPFIGLFGAFFPRVIIKGVIGRILDSILKIK